MPKDRPFKDALAKRGSPPKTSHRVKLGVQFKLYDETRLEIVYPGGKRLVSKKACYKLGSWLLNMCREDVVK